MPAFEPGRQIEADGARLVGDALFVRQPLPGRALKTDGDRAAQQGMVGRVELDEVDPLAGRAVRPQFRRRPVGDTRQILRFRRGCELARRLEFGMQAARQAIGDILEKRIGKIGVVAGQRRGLIVFVGRRTAGFLRAHAPPPTGIRRAMHGGCCIQ